MGALVQHGRRDLVSELSPSWSDTGEDRRALCVCICFVLAGVRSREGAGRSDRRRKQRIAAEGLTSGKPQQVG
jgi:hypothetical protein